MVGAILFLYGHIIDITFITNQSQQSMLIVKLLENCKKKILSTCIYWFLEHLSLFYKGMQLIVASETVHLIKI